MTSCISLIAKSVITFCFFSHLLFGQESLTQDQLIDKVTAATAFVKQSDFGEGTAFCIRKDGLFITNWHVPKNVNIQETVPLVINSGQPGKEKTVQARLLSTSVPWDLALLKVDGKTDWPHLELLKDEAEIKLLTPIFACGFPFGKIAQQVNPSITINQGKVSSLGRDPNGKLLHVRFDAAINPGNSGGPLVDQQGRVLGVVGSKMRGERTSFAISHSLVKEFLKQPGLGMQAELVKWIDRKSKMDFNIQIVTEFGTDSPDEIELELSADGIEKRVVSKKLNSSIKQIVISAAPDTREKLSVLVRKTQASNFNNNPITVLKDRIIHEKSNTRLTDLSRIIYLSKNLVEFEYHDRKPMFVDPKELVNPQDFMPSNLRDASVIHINDNWLGVIQCIIRAKKQGKVIKELMTTFSLLERPAFTNFAGDPPVVETDEPLTEFFLQFPLEGKVVFGLGETGLQDFAHALFVQFPLGQKPPGNFSLRGPFLTINNKLWHHQNQVTNRHYANVLPIDIAKGKWQCEVERDWAATKTKKELLEGEAIVKQQNKATIVEISSPENKLANYKLRFYTEE